MSMNLVSSHTPQEQTMLQERIPAEPQWHGLYRLGTIFSVLVIVLVFLAIAAFLGFAYAPREIPVAEILTNLQDDLFGTLLSLDLLLLITQLVMIVPFVALYVALRSVNESYALLALVLGLMSVVLIAFARPITELIYLSEQYTNAPDETTRQQYLAASTALIAVFDGTAWMAYAFLLGISSTITSFLMLKSASFTRLTAYVGLVVAIASLGFFLPVIGALLLLITTFGGIVWYVLVARDFYRLGWRTTA
jgi:hypothetical protein